MPADRVEASDSNEVNPHYLDHVVHTADVHTVAVTQDIVSQAGVKLLAKGARVDASMRERLLQHKLMRPLEECLEVVGAVNEAQIQAEAKALLDQHPMLQAVFGAVNQPDMVLGKLGLSAEVLSMLSVFAQHRPQRLSHACGVALLAKGLARRLFVGDMELHKLLTRAGLLHDIGELYLDPQLWQRDRLLGPDEWRHVITHPVVGHKVLSQMPGAGQVVADAVLCHHERLDGFGYPRGLRGERCQLQGQVLAAAEWLMGVLEAGTSVAMHARIAAKLVEGEFAPELSRLLGEAVRGLMKGEIDLQGAARSSRVAEVYRAMQMVKARYGDIEGLVGEGSAELRALLRPCAQRLTRLQLAFSSAGLDAQQPDTMMALLGPEDEGLRQELEAMAHEFEWRLRELERAVLMRAHALAPEDQALVQGLVASFRSAEQDLTPAPPAVADDA
ncbi:HD domain-containing phosphohydrolase [Paucibacter sp. APW11]|uniref:HD domain-containing phosphohydrolase n=1 Tax=Roseateles aquae TaxID=3077235 RepID=A0ABU3PDX8_9BURK|nr:HD domain-containing phosphohydrolase [Paucibacter sp. APW11]MDT9000753.1 HD domain-containing phosphohydrolase [Paucibacter sp. APW11]